MEKLRALYYINQFYAGIGGEEKADVGLSIFEGAKGPAMGLQRFWKDEMEVVNTICCGDNYFNNDEKYAEVIKDIDKIIEQVKPNVFIAGPAFNAGRYGVACAKICDYVKKNHNIPSVTAMYYENPAVNMYVKDNYIIETPETAAGMSKIISPLGKFALKLAKGEKIGVAREEGYLPTGHRYNEYDSKSAAERVVDMLMKKLKGEKHYTEVPLRGFEQIPPSPALKTTKESTIALVTTGGLVPKGNPDKLRQAFSTTYGKYNVSDVEILSKDHYESIHGGYDTTIVNEDPNRLVPLDQLKVLAKEGLIKEVYNEFFTTCGVGTNVENSKVIGKSIADTLKANGVTAVILTST